MARPSTRRQARRARVQPQAQAADPVVAATETAIARPELRAHMREEDPRARASKRAAELRDHLGEMDEGVDKFYVDPADIPDGWDYEWKRVSVFGKQDPAYEVQTARKGWEAVPASRHPSYMPGDAKYKVIERDGLVLMERPKEISDEARRAELRKARLQVQRKEEELTGAAPGQFERKKGDGSSAVTLGKSYEPIPIPD